MNNWPFRTLLRHNLISLRHFSSDSSNLSKSWTWVPPSRTTLTIVDPNDIIPVIERVFIKSEEIKLALERQGAEDIKIIKLNKKLDSISEFIFASGRSSRHLRVMGDSIVTALKLRKLKEAPGITGIEGSQEDDWQLIDCYNCVVHLMLPDKRKLLALEEHWSGGQRPYLHQTGDHKLDDLQFEHLLDNNPIPDSLYSETDFKNTTDVGKISLENLKRL